MLYMCTWLYMPRRRTSDKPNLFRVLFKRREKDILRFRVKGMIVSQMKDLSTS